MGDGVGGKENGFNVNRTAMVNQGRKGYLCSWIGLHSFVKKEDDDYCINQNLLLELMVKLFRI